MDLQFHGESVGDELRLRSNRRRSCSSTGSSEDIDGREEKQDNVADYCERHIHSDFKRQGLEANEVSNNAWFLMFCVSLYAKLQTYVEFLVLR
jgi:hypothetical protein